MLADERGQGAAGINRETVTKLDCIDVGREEVSLWEGNYGK